MKKILPLVCILVPAMYSCSDDGKERIEQIYVASARLYYNLPIGGEHLHFLVRSEPSEQWRLFGNIRGFNYEPGYEYQLKVRVTPYRSNPQMVPDSDMTLYECLEIISRTEKVSDDLPPQAVLE